MVRFSRVMLCASSVAALVLSAAAAVAASAAPVQYTVDAARSLLRFTFVQAGAENTGRFRSLKGDIRFSPENLAASRIDVTIDVASLDTGDEERDTTLRGADLFDVAKFPQARFVATKFTPNGTSRYDAQGKLTIRNVTRDLTVPITFQTKTEQGQQVGYMTGRVTIRRLDFGVGQGEWKSTEWVNDNVTVSFSLRLAPVTT
jgi:polyisoprenoid-binding protein YceI